MKWLTALLLASVVVAGCATVPVAGTAAPVAQARAQQAATPVAGDPPATEISEADRREIQVVESGFGSFPLPYHTGLLRTVGVVVRNPNPTTWTASGVDLQITMRDAAGEVIPFDANARVEAIPPGATRAYGFTKEGSGATANAVPAKVDVTIAPVKFWLRTGRVVPGDITFGKATVSPLTSRGLSPDSPLQVSCDATSTLAIRPKVFLLVLLYRDAAGGLTGGARLYATIDRTDFSVAPNAVTRLDAEIPYPPPDVPASVECFPSYSPTRL